MTGIIRSRLIPRVLAADPGDLLDDEGANLDPERISAIAMRNEKPGGHGERAVALSALDMAVFDAVAKIAEQPLCRLIAERYGDGACDERVSVYAAGGYYQPEKDVEALQEELRGYRRLGYRSVKIKIGGAPLDPRDLDGETSDERRLVVTQTAGEATQRRERWQFELVDLSRELNEETAYALLGDIAAGEENRHYSQVQLSYDREWSTSNGTLCHLSMPDHIGTHMDAPLHCREGGASLEQVDIGRLFGEAVVLDLYKGDVDYGYTAADLESAQPQIEAGDIVLIYSGYRDVTETERIRQTYLTVEAAHWLVERGVSAVGCEPAGIEHVPDGLFKYRWYDKDTPNLPSWPAHQVLLGNDVYIIEGLTNLDRLKGRRVRFAGLPLRIPGASGCPIRAVAWIDR
jgi:kynurenine formamidase